MNSTAPLTGAHLRTYTTIFQHPVSHNLKWHDVHSLFRELGEVKTEANGNLKVTRNGQSLVLHPPRTKDVAETEELMELRHFLTRSASETAETDKTVAHWLLVIDHREARIFRTEMEGATPLRILPHPPEEYFRQAQDSKEVSRGSEKPDPNSYFVPVARALQAPGPILILGSGTGMSSEMEQFVSWSKAHHPDLAKRILGSLTINESHLTEGELLARARNFYSNAEKASL